LDGVAVVVGFLREFVMTLLMFGALLIAAAIPAVVIVVAAHRIVRRLLGLHAEPRRRDDRSAVGPDWPWPKADDEPPVSR
jgi:hypothetical protein